MTAEIGRSDCHGAARGQLLSTRGLLRPRSDSAEAKADRRPDAQTTPIEHP
mgnify:CR=1 FL=1|jgi:hypothetical protein